VAYGDGLENRCRFRVTVGSNPTPSANFFTDFHHGDTSIHEYSIGNSKESCYLIFSCLTGRASI
jgi:hypothetical protein